MNQQWQQFLTDNGAQVTDTADLGFAGDNQLAPDNALCALTGQAVLRVTGHDATDFLQGQFSNDVTALASPGSQLTTWSSPKGRVLVLLRLYRDESGYLIVLPAEQVEAFVKRLRMYVLMAKVVVEEQPQLVCLGLGGRSVGDVVSKSLNDAPSDIDTCISHGDTIATRVRGTVPRFEIIAPVETACELWSAWSEDCQPCGESVWRLQNIDAGVPGIANATSEAFVLQMLNLQHIDGVSFKKGCFPGQEVVARMQYLGKLKRRMYRAAGTGDDLPVPGDDVYNESTASAVGKVVDAQAVGDGTYRMLAVCAIAAAEKPLFLEPEARRSLELLDLPYSLEAG